MTLYSEKLSSSRKNDHVLEKKLNNSEKCSFTRKNAHALEKLLRTRKMLLYSEKYLCTQRNVPLTWKSAPVLGKLLLVLENIFPAQGKMHPCTQGKIKAFR